MAKRIFEMKRVEYEYKVFTMGINPSETKEKLNELDKDGFRLVFVSANNRMFMEKKLKNKLFKRVVKLALILLEIR